MFEHGPFSTHNQNFGLYTNDLVYSVNLVLGHRGWFLGLGPTGWQTSCFGIFFLLVFFTGFLSWAYQAACPPAPKKVGPPDGLPITTPRIKLRDGRYLSYKEYGVRVPKESAKYKLIFAHGFDSVKHYAVIATSASPALIEDLGIYIVSFDRPGYGESDPDPKRTLKSLALDTEELADQLELGSKFYVVGFSMGGQVIWSYLKYIPHSCSCHMYM
ncbi:putative alpha/beta hydrolase-1 [Helianthus annuus]|uniref:Putative alpha/Beta hydrolase fold protein n=1 Tax=Helianthus annuus TaxID=4232 RepID=A0A251TP19_HELAN|nr:putative alpha/beta hydrolase-1 [Helianthus annuus]